MQSGGGFQGFHGGRGFLAGEVESHLAELPLYPEGRPCSRPTTRRVLDYFAPLSSHTLTTSPTSTTITTELTPLHRRILQLLGVPTAAYDQ